MQPVRDLSKITPLDTIYIHEDHREWFYRQFPPPAKSYRVFEIQLDPLWGIDVRFSSSVPKYAKRWVFPDTPFVEYSEADEVWARPVKFGYEVDTDEPAIFAISPVFLSNYYLDYKPNLLWSSA